MRVLWEQLRDEIAKKSDRASALLVVAFAAGIALFFTWRTDPSWWVTVAIVAVGAGALLLRGRFSAVGYYQCPCPHFSVRAAQVAVSCNS